jgi:membrane-associated phospholipid phosphatase
MKTFCRNGRGLRIFCVALILLAGRTAGAEQRGAYDLPNQPGQPEQLCSPVSENMFLSSFINDSINWPERILLDANDILLRYDNLAGLLLAGGASIAIHQSNADKELARHFIKHRVFESSIVDESLNALGCPGTHFAAAGLWYALSAEDGDQFNKERAWTMMTALAITGLTTVGLKAIRDNETPNGKAWAWPSGHTSSSFTAAAVLDEFYGPGVGIPAYMLAGLVGFRMMDAGDHWASDVVFGATLGWVVGHTVAGKQKKLELAGFEVLPYTAGMAVEPSVGVTLVKRF